MDREVSDLPRLEFSDLLDELEGWREQTRVVVDNSAVEPESRLSYDDSIPPRLSSLEATPLREVLPWRVSSLATSREASARWTP